METEVLSVAQESGEVSGSRVEKNENVAVEKETVSKANETVEKNQSLQEGELIQNSEEQEMENIVPKKFIDKNGKVNVKELAKSYKNIEHLVNEKAQWQKTKDNLEKQLRTISEKEDVSKQNLCRQVNNYAKFVDEAKNPESVKELIKEFEAKPSEELFNQIEENFSPRIIKNVQKEFDAENKLSQQQELRGKLENEYRLVHEFVSSSKEKYPEHFGNPAFNSLFKEAVGLLGTEFDAAGFIELVDDYANSKMFNFLLKLVRGKDNLGSIKEISKIVPSNKTASKEELPPADLLKIEDKELLKKYIKKYSKK